MSALLRSFLVMTSVGVLSAHAQTPASPPPAASDFVVREWHGEDGLPHEDVLQLQQDQAGYLWVAYRGGLCRFDGTTFLLETAPEARDFFLTVAAESDGSLLLTPREGDPVRYRNGKYTREPLPAPYLGRPIGVRFRAPDGAQWYSVRGAVLRLTAGEVRAFGASDGIAENWTRFAVDVRGRVWLANNLFLARYDEGNLTRVPVNADTSELRIVSSRTGGPWVITPTQVLKFDADDRAVEVTSISPMLGAHYINAAIEDRNGLLWLGTRSDGLHVFGRDGHFHVPTSSDTIMALFEDRDGTMWVGASSGGLSAIARKVYTLYNKSSGLAATAVSAVCADDAGDIWVANGDGGVARIRGSQVDKWVLQSITRPLAAGAVSRHPGGGVWATGGTGAAVFLIPGENGEASIVNDVPSRSVRATMFTASQGDLWLATSDRRVSRLQGRSYQVFGPDEGVPPAGARTFAETAAGKILLGTNDGTLLQFDGNRFVPAPWPHLNVPSAINAIQPLGEDLWLGTASNGLVICRGAKSLYLGSANGLPDDNLTQMMPDGRGNVWIGSGRGVFRVAISEVERVVRGETTTLFPLRLGKDEGLGTVTSQGIFGPGVAKSRDGRIWFATRQGVLAVNPVAEAFTPPPPTTRIEQVLADDVLQPLSHLWTVNSHVRKLELRFSVLCLSAPSRVQTRYRLVGFDTDWVYSRPGVAAIYPRLPPGSYRFEVAAGFGNGVASAPTEALEIVVSPQWWQMVWVRLAGAAIVITVITLIGRAWSHRRLRHRIENLERETAVARVRERIARDIHDEVGASLTRISLLTQTSSPHSPEAENLNRIDETAREVTRSLDEIVWVVNPHQDTLESFISYLTDFAQKFLGAARIRCRLLIPSALPSVPLSSEARHDLFLCCRESLNNIVKHAAASEVTIRLTLSDSVLTITLVDDGRGLSAEPSVSPPERVSTGHGLVNLRQRMDRIGGSCVIESPATGGTSVTLAVDLRRISEASL